MERIDNLVEYLQCLKKGGKAPIHIKKENRGKFTKSAKAAGHSVQEHARAVLNNPNATPLQKKRANFARNAAKWHHKHKYGGIIEYQIGGSMIYSPFLSEPTNTNEIKKNDYVQVYEDRSNPEFPVEPVQTWQFNLFNPSEKQEAPDNYVGERVYPLGKVYKHSEKDQFKSDLYNSYIDSLSNKEFYINGETRKLTEEEIDAFAKQIVAQDGLESAHGTSSLSKYYNFGGVKDFRENADSLKVDTVEYDKNKNRSVKKQPFRKFKNLKEYTDYKVNLLNGNRYKAFSYGPDIFYDRIIAGGYATDPNYRWKLNSINKSYWK